MLIRLTPSLWVLPLLFLGMLVCNSCFAELKIIANKSVTQSDITLRSVRAIFGMRKLNWDNDKPVTVFVLPDKNPKHIEFSKTKIQLFPYQLRKAWDRLVFSGTGQAPREVSSQQEMQEMVSNTPNAIGYLEHSLIDSNKVHTLQVTQ